MVSLSAVNQARSEVQDLITLGIRDVSALVNELSSERPETIAQVLAEFLPAISDMYGVGVAERAADFYLEQRAEAMVASSFTPPSIVLPDAGQVDSLARYAAAPAFAQGDFRALVKSRAVGGLSRILTGIWADTLADFGAVDSSPVRYQRMPRADCCAFCAMLASRGAVYESEAAATRVVGRGVPIGKHRLSKGTRQRGSQRIGEAFHDHCRCIGVAVFPGRAQQMEASTAKYFEAYKEAAAKDGSLKTRQHGEGPEGNHTTPDKEILKQMRLILDAK